MMRPVIAEATEKSGPYHGTRAEAPAASIAATIDGARLTATTERARSRCAARALARRRRQVRAEAERLVAVRGERLAARDRRASPPRRSTRGGSPGRPPTSRATASPCATRDVAGPGDAARQRVRSRRRGAPASALEVRAAHRPCHLRRALLGEGARSLLGVLAPVDRLPERLGRVVRRGHREVHRPLRGRHRQRRVRRDQLASACTSSCSPPSGTTRFTSPTSWARAAVAARR